MFFRLSSSVFGLSAENRRLRTRDCRQLKRDAANTIEGMLRKRDEENGCQRNHRNQAGDDANLPGRRHAGGMHGSSGGAMRGGTAPDETDRRLRGRAIGARGIRQAAAREQGHDWALQEGQRRAHEGAAGSAHRGIARRDESRRSRAGGELQDRRARRCERRQQGQGFSRRRKALALPRRRCDARLDASPRAGRHRRQFVSVACLEESALSGSYGKRAGDRKEFESREGGHRREPAAGAGIGAGAERNVHLHPQGEKSEVRRSDTSLSVVSFQWSVFSEDELSVAGSELRKKNSLT